MVDSCCILTGHAGPVLIRPEISVFTPRYRHLVPELGPHPGEGLGLGHGQGDLDSLHQDLDVLRVGEVSRMEDWFIVRVVAPQQDPTPGLRSEQHWYDGPSVSVGQWSVHLPHIVTDTVGLEQNSLHSSSYLGPTSYDVVHNWSVRQTACGQIFFFKVKHL